MPWMITVHAGIPAKYSAQADGKAVHPDAVHFALAVIAKPST